MGRILREQGTYRLEENQNYEPGTGNLFLIVKGELDPWRIECVGGADFCRNTGKWEVGFQTCPDDEGNDWRIDCVVDTQDEAITALWDRRYCGTRFTV